MGYDLHPMPPTASSSPTTSAAPHASHADIVKRLRRAGGHLQNVVAMLESGRPCTEIAQQLHAVERAITVAKQQMIHDHIDHCLDHALESPSRTTRGVLDEFKAIAKYL